MGFAWEPLKDWGGNIAPPPGLIGLKECLCRAMERRGAVDIRFVTIGFRQLKERFISKNLIILVQQVSIS